MEKGKFYSCDWDCSGLVVLCTANPTDEQNADKTFSGVAIVEGDGRNVGDYSDNWAQIHFEECSININQNCSGEK